MENTTYSIKTVTFEERYNEAQLYELYENIAEQKFNKRLTCLIKAKEMYPDEKDLDCLISIANKIYEYTNS